MKNSLKAIRSVVAILSIWVVSQATVFAQSNDNTTKSSGLSAGQIVGGFAILLFAILLPLVKRSKKTISHK